jgi:signal transduction histidine kinase/FixJ family two-component response regulator
MARVAIVEDEYVVALNVERMLARAGHECVGIFHSGEEFLSACASLEPELALIDIHLAGELDGLEVASRLFASRDIPVIFVTAYADASMVAKAKETQPFGYILKPFSERDLTTTIELGLYRAEMQRQLRASEDRYKSLFERGPTAKFILSPSGAIIGKNAAFDRMVGEVCPASINALFAPGQEAMAAEVVSEESGDGREVTFNSDRGGVPVVLGFRRIADRSQGSYIIQCEALDLSERKLLEDRLSMAARMESLGRLAGGIAHDFNNILTSIQGYVHLLIQDSSITEKARQSAEGIKRTAKRAADLTRQLLAFSKNREAKPEPLSLNRLGEDCQDMLKRLLPESIRIRFYWKALDDTVKIDQGQYVQVLMNLVVNAKDAIEGDGTITVETKDVELDDSVLKTGLEIAAGKYVALVVGDTGRGIEAPIIARIFEPFFTTKGAGKGTGLGLATVYGIAKSMGGGVDVESSPGGPTKFTVYFPVAGRYVEARTPLANPSPVRVASVSSVLVVEDDPEARVAVQAMLQSFDIRVSSSGDPFEAVELARSGDFSAVVTDVNLPGMDGFSMASIMEDARPGMIMVFMSGFVGIEVPTRWANSPLLSKPFEAEAIAVALERAASSRNGSMPTRR